MNEDGYCYYFGRWQSPHLGHRWLINQRLNTGEKVCICVRPMETDENNPFTQDEVVEMLMEAFFDELKTGRVVIHALPVDVKEVVYGRGVGYGVTCLESQCPEHIKRISATEIRRQIRAGESGWRNMVMAGVEPYLEEKFSS